MHRRQLFHQTDRNIDSSAIANTKRWVNDLFLQISIQAAVRNWSTGEAVSGTSYMPTGKQEKAHHKTGTGGSSICLGQPSVISRYFSPSSAWLVRQASKSWQHEVIKGWLMQIQTRVSGTKEIALHGQLIRCMRGIMKLTHIHRPCLENYQSCFLGYSLAHRICSPPK